MRSTKLSIAIAFLCGFVFVFAACSLITSSSGTTYLPTATVPTLNYSIPATQFYQQVKVTASQAGTQVITPTSTLLPIQGSVTPVTPLQETAQAEPLYTTVQQLYNTGVITSTQGLYYHLPDFKDQWAARDYYDFLLTDDQVTNFVIQSTLEWQSAGTIVDYANAGCGFVFRLNARGDHYLAYLGSDGNAYLYLTLNHNLKQIGKGRFNNNNVVTGSAKLLLAAQGARLTLDVDDKQILQVTDPTLSTGLLGHAIASGTDQDYGTQCRMTNNDLWKIEKP